MQSISIGYGKANFDRASTSLSAFVVTEPWVRQFPSKVLQRKGRLQDFPVTAHPDINGRMMLDTLEVGDGTLLLIQAGHRLNGSPIRDGAIFIRLREQGPMLTVQAKVSVHRDSLIGERYLVFQGRGDLMGLEDLAEIGIQPQRVWVEGFMDGEEIEQCFDITELSSEIAPRPKVERVTSLSGTEVTLKVSTPSRRIKVRS